VDLFGPRFRAKYRRARLAAGLTDSLLARAVDALPAVLRSTGPVTRTELAERLRDMGVNIGAKGQAPAHLVVVASLAGILCCGPDTNSGKSTYALLDAWVPRPQGKPKDPLAELAKRYLAGHGPASVIDFAVWSGLPTTEAREAIESVSSDFDEALINGERVWLQATTDSRAQFVRLLGSFDACLLAASGLAAAPTQKSYAPKPAIPELPAYIAKAFKTNVKVWQHFQALAPTYRRHFVVWIHIAKRPETRERRIRESIELLSAGKKLGLK
jgi:hypothetical protein